VRRTLTPELRLDVGPTTLLLIDLAAGRHRLGGSCLSQVYGALGDAPPDLDDPELLKRFFAAVRALARAGWIQAYHDRSDGGLLVTLVEMAFAARAGLEIDLGAIADPVAALYSEELGAVIQVRDPDLAAVEQLLAERGLGSVVRRIGRPAAHERVLVRTGAATVLDEARSALHRAWSETSFRMREMRDDPSCAREEFATLDDDGDPGLTARPTYDVDEDVAAPFIARGARPQVAVLREQGVNSQVEMAAALERAGFAPDDVHMTDLLTGRVSLSAYRGLIACGGFSYGDVLGAGQGWAKSILYHARARDQFSEFFARADSFALGICNGCQMFAALKELIPGAEHWPIFVRNRSEQFEGRLSLVEVQDSPSLFYAGMAGSVLPIAVSHGEGRARFATPAAQSAVTGSRQVSLKFVDGRGRVAERYPANPNGSPDGIAGLTTSDGRVTVAMPHPERVFRAAQCSWHPSEWREDSGWMRMFRNARVWLG
jgi:phosphoribosylformylglycinamidine synthase